MESALKGQFHEPMNVDDDQIGVNELRRWLMYVLVWGGVTVVQKCDGHQGGVKGIIKVYQLMERYDGHGGDVTGFGKV